MGIVTYPLNGVTYDADDVQTYLCTRTSGVYSDEDCFDIKLKGDMTVQIGTGIAWIKNGDFAGKSICMDEAQTLELSIGGSTYPRRDRIILKFDATAGETTLEVLEGDASSSATAPSIEQSEDVYELGLYSIYVAAGATELTSANITDTRLDESVCGLMSDAVTTIPTETLQAQATELIDDLQEEIDGVTSGSSYMLRTTYDPAGGKRQVAFQDDLDDLEDACQPECGGEYESQGGMAICAGYLISSKKKLRFFIPYFSANEGAELTLNSVRARQNGKLLVAYPQVDGGTTFTADSNSLGTQSITRMASGWYVTLTYTSALSSGTTAAPVAVYCRFTVTNSEEAEEEDTETDSGSTDTETGTSTDVDLSGYMETATYDPAGGAKQVAFLADTVLGEDAEVSDEYDIAIGNVAIASGSSIAVGPSALASGASSTVVGSEATAEGEGGLAIGYGATASGEHSNAVGYNAVASGRSAIAISYTAEASGTAGIAIGEYAEDSANYGVAIGHSANSSGGEGAAVGNEATASGADATAIGNKAKATASTTVAIGNAAKAYATSATTIGNGAYADAEKATAIGRNADAGGENSMAIGYSANAAEDNAIVLGDENIASFNCAVDLTVTSDIRDKTDVETLDDGATEFLKQIEPIRYVRNPRVAYIDKENLSDEDLENYRKYGMCAYDEDAYAAGEKKGERVRVGVSAQEVQEALESVYGSADYANMVNDSLHDYDEGEIPDGVESRLSVDYSAFVPFLIKAVQELSARVEELESESGVKG